MIDREELIRAIFAAMSDAEGPWKVSDVLGALDRAGYEVVLRAAPQAAIPNDLSLQHVREMCDAAARRGAAMALRAVARTAPTVEQKRLLWREADEIEGGER